MFTYTTKHKRQRNRCMHRQSSAPVHHQYREQADRVKRVVAHGEGSHSNRQQGAVQRFRFQMMSGGESETAEASPLVHDVLRASGRPLEAEPRRYMESRFGRDFGDVRIHTGEEAAASAEAVNALAYTVDHDIVFGHLQYEPATASGRKILAHELAHVAQLPPQGTAAVSGGRLPLSRAEGAAEKEAHAVAGRVAAGESVRVSQPASAKVLWPWRGSFDITTRLPESRRFSVTSGSVTVECAAQWKRPASCPSSSNYTITLWRDVPYWFDSNHGSQSYSVPGTDTHSWSDLPSGTYYLEIYYPNSNPNCRVLGDLNVTT